MTDQRHEDVTAVSALPAAESLPPGSVVTVPNGAFFKDYSSAEFWRPWSATHLPGALSNARIDNLLQSGTGVILRVGHGA